MIYIFFVFIRCTCSGLKIFSGEDDIDGGDDANLIHVFFSFLNGLISNVLAIRRNSANR